MNVTNQHSCVRRPPGVLRLWPQLWMRCLTLLAVLGMAAGVAWAQTTISTLSLWDGAQAASPLGVPSSVAADVYGQVFTVPSDHPVLTDFKIQAGWLYGQGVTLTAYIAPWDGSAASASPVYSGPATTLDTSQSGFTLLDFPFSGLTLTAGARYVFYLVASNASGGPAAACVGVTGVHANSTTGGSFVYTHTYGEDANLLFPWDVSSGASVWGDTAFEAVFSGSVPVVQPTSLAVIAPSSATVSSALTFQVMALDSYGNVLTSYTGPVHFSSTDSDATLPANSALTAGAGSFQATLVTTGSQTISATSASNSALTAASGAIVVSAANNNSPSTTAGPAVSLAFSNLPTSTEATSTEATSTFSVKLTAYDANNNVATGYNGTVHFTSNDPSALLSPDTAMVNGVGNFGFGLLCAGSYPTTCTITATDASNSLQTTSSPITVTASTTDHMVLTASAPTLTAGASIGVILAASDLYGYPDSSYAGTVRITGTDPNMSVQLSDPILGNIPWTSGPLPQGTANLIITLNTAGVQTITATDTTTGAITGSTYGIPVTPGSAVSLQISNAPSTTTPGSSFHATVSGVDAQGNVATSLTDTLHFTSTDGQAVLPADSALVAGSGSFPFTLNTVGSQTLTATDKTHASLTVTSSAISVQQIGAASVRVVAGSGQKAGIGSAFAVPLQVKVFDASATPLAGVTVHFSAPGSGASALLSSATAVTASDGTASVTATANGVLGTISYTVSASVNGVSMPASFTLRNQLANTGLQLSTSPTASVYGVPVVLNSVLTPTSAGGVAPTGTMLFRDGASELASNVALATGQSGLTASYTVTAPQAGMHRFGAVYSGDSNFWFSEVLATVVVAKARTTLETQLTSVSFLAPAGVSIPVQVGVTSSGSGIATPTGSLTWTLDGGTAQTATITAGSANIPVPAGLSQGSHSVVVSYGGDSNYAAAPDNLTISLTATKATPTLTLSSSLNPALVTGGITFTATVSSTAGTPTGSVGFYDGTTLLSTVALANKQAAYTTSSLAVGTHSITAVYSGDAGFVSVTSSAISELVQDFTVSTPVGTGGTPTASVIPGGTATYSLSFGPSAGTAFPAPVNLSLSGVPPGATGTLTPSTLPAGSGLTNVTLTVKIPQGIASRSPQNGLQKLSLLLSVLVLPWAWRLRRRGRKLWALGILVVAMGMSLTGLSACGGKIATVNQPPTSYNITISATCQNVTKTTMVTLIVE